MFSSYQYSFFNVKKKDVLICNMFLIMNDNEYKHKYKLYKCSVHINTDFLNFTKTDVLQLAACHGDEMNIHCGHLERNLC